MEEEQFLYKYQFHGWNSTAKDCYKRGCICAGCPLHELIFKHHRRGCQMKNAVFTLVRELGIPDDLIRKEIIIED